MNFRNLLIQLGLVAGNAAAKWDPFGIAALLLDAYGKKREKDHLRAELEALMRADFQQFRAQLQDAMGELRLQLAESVRAQVEAYLSQFQASARQAARHLGDPSATTVPATVGVDDPQQLAAFLPQRPPQFTVGSVVPGLPSWTLIEPLGVGGFGEVWKARHEDDGVIAAFKFFLDPTARSRFTAAEAKVLKEIHQKAPTDGVVKLIQAEARQDPPWIQFEYIPGGDLSRLPESWAKLPAAERVARAQSVIRSLATTAGHFHNLGVVHRDLKPSNVLLRENGSLVVADFGISRILPSGAGTAPTPTNSALATIRAYTPAYASPQQKKFLPADRRDDVYALAVLWYQLLRGDFSLESPRGDGWKDVLARMGVSEDAVKLLNRSWDDDPDVRPKDGNELAARLGAERLVVRPVVAQPLPPPVAPRVTPVPKPQPASPPPPESRAPLHEEPVARSGPPERAKHPRDLIAGVVVCVVFSTLICFLMLGLGLYNTHLKPRSSSSSATAEQQGRLVTDPRDPNLKPGDVYVLKIGNPAVDMRFRWCPPGWFMMGGKAAFDNAEPIHKVTITKGFWMGETEVTQAQWRSVMKENPNPSKFKGDDLPVENVTALDADAFGEAVKRATGKPFRLPFEAEWEYACRAGTSTDYHTGNGDDALKRAGWYEGNSGSTTHPVGKLAPNAWGLFDMHGNVWEWCIDEYRPYKAGDQIDPFLQSNNNTRSYRGGSWGDSPACCLAAHRFWSESGGRCSYLGLRVCFCQD